MKKLVIFLWIGVLLSSMIFAGEYKTGDVFANYFPNRYTNLPSNIDSPERGIYKSCCHISEISKAANYPEGTYNLKLISVDYFGISTANSLYFNYIIKKEGILEISKDTYIYDYDTKGRIRERKPVKLRVINISENKIEVEELKETSFEEVKTSEDSL